MRVNKIGFGFTDAKFSLLTISPHFLALHRNSNMSTTYLLPPPSPLGISLAGIKTILASPKTFANCTLESPECEPFVGPATIVVVNTDNDEDVLTPDFALLATLPPDHAIDDQHHLAAADERFYIPNLFKAGIEDSRQRLGDRQAHSRRQFIH